MAGTSSTLTRLRHDEHGLTVLELTLVMTLGLLILFGVLFTWQVAYSQEDQVSDRSDALERVDVAVDRLQDDVREAHSVAVSSSGRVLDLTVARATSGVVSLRSLRWDCSATDSGTGLRRCDRTLSGGTAERMLEGLAASGTPFVLTPGTTPVVALDLQVQTGSQGIPIAIATKLSPRACQTTDVLSC